jgi:condensin complex subunit 3
MPGRTKKRLESEPLDVAIPRIFEQVQSSTANHAKNFVALRKLHVEAAAEVKEIQKGRGLQLVGEAAFREAFLQATVRILPVKKGVAVADRVVRFIGGYIKHINKKGPSVSITATVALLLMINQPTRRRRQRLARTRMTPWKPAL